MYFFSRIPVRIWERLAWGVYAVGIVLLLSVLVIGQSVNGAKRWINIAGLPFQPSEIAKFSMILLFARLTKKYGENARDSRYGVLGFGCAMLGLLVPLALEKHLSAIMLMGMVGVVMMFVAGTSPKWLAAGAAAAAAFVLIYISFMGYAGDRVTAWLHPEQDPEIRAIKSYNPCMPSAPGDCSALDLENQSKSTFIYRFNIMTTSLPLFAKSWGLWGRF